MRNRTRQQGIALIELMVGLMIGLMTTVAIAQVVSWAEKQRRNVMSGEDAQISGMLAIHALSRDIRQAGYGLTNNPLALGCSLSGDKYGGQSLPSIFAPVVINDDVDSNGLDSISVFESSKSGASLPLLITEDHDGSADSFVVKSTFSAASGDYLVAVPETWSSSNGCAVFQVSGIYTAASAACTVGSGVACTRVGHASGATDYFPSTGYPADSYLLNLGSTIRYRTYAIADKVLQLTALGSTAKDAFPQIVNLQAYYAKDDDGDGTVDWYDVATPDDAKGWAKVIGVRLAVVARSTHYEKDAVTLTSPEWELGSATGIPIKDKDGKDIVRVDCASGSGGKCVSLLTGSNSEIASDIAASDGTYDWQHYRYKVFDTTIPMRNSLWNS